MTRCLALVFLAFSAPLASPRRWLRVKALAFMTAGPPSAMPRRSAAMPSPRRKGDCPPLLMPRYRPGRTSGVRGQLHLVLSRAVADKATVRLTIAGRRFDLVAKGRNAWARDAREDAAIIAALRVANRMSVFGPRRQGRQFHPTVTPLPGSPRRWMRQRLDVARRRLTGQTLALRLYCAATHGRYCTHDHVRGLSDPVPPPRATITRRAPTVALT